MEKMRLALPSVLLLLFIILTVEGASIHLNTGNVSFCMHSFSPALFPCILFTKFSRTVDVASLQDVPLCPLAKVCHFDAKIDLSVKESQTSRKDDGEHDVGAAA